MNSLRFLSKKTVLISDEEYKAFKSYSEASGTNIKFSVLMRQLLHDFLDKQVKKGLK